MLEFITHCLFGCRCQLSSMCYKNAPKTATKGTAYETALCPVLIGAGLLVSGSIITGLANADMDDALHKRDKFMPKSSTSIMMV